MAEEKRPEREKLRDQAMTHLLKVRMVTWELIELYHEDVRDKIAWDFDGPFKALQKAVIDL